MIDFRATAAHLVRTALNFGLQLLLDWMRFVVSIVRSRAASSAEILFLRKQLAFYQEHQIKPRRLTEEARVSLAFWSQWFNWRESLVIVKPETLIRWHGKGFQLFWRRKSRMGRPGLRADIRQLIVRMVKENPTWLRPGKAVGIDCLKGGLIRPFVPSDVAYEVGAAR